MTGLYPVSREWAGNKIYVIHGEGMNVEEQDRSYGDPGLLQHLEAKDVEGLNVGFPGYPKVECYMKTFVSHNSIK